MRDSPVIGQDGGPNQNDFGLAEVEAAVGLNQELENEFSDIKTHLYCHIVFILVIRVA
jgi:hypothetical protein